MVFVALVAIGIALGGIWVKVCIGLGLIAFAVGTVGGVLSRKTKGIQRVVDILIIVFVVGFVISVLLSR